MAKKIKVPNEILKRRERAEQQRKVGIRSKNVFYLIVCEGAKTEPNYFEVLKDDLPKGVLTNCQIDIEGAGMNTQSLLKEARRLKGKYERGYSRKIDKLWIVCDRDSFPPGEFNNMVIACRDAKPSIGCAWSNEAFELWYLLHFHFYNNPMQRQDYKGRIEDNLRPIIGNGFTYQKNSEAMYGLLKEHGNVEAAIQRAKQLEAQFQGAQDYANHNPCTMVYKLIEELLALKPIIW